MFLLDVIWGHFLISKALHELLLTFLLQASCEILPLKLMSTESHRLPSAHQAALAD